jgi:hypothetical protein
MEIYRMLGMDPEALELWREVHGRWRLKGAYSTAMLKEMRLTG